MSKAICLNEFNSFYYSKFDKLATQAKSKGSLQIGLVFKTVCDSIKKYPYPIISLDQIKNMIGVGKTIINKFDLFINEYREIIIKDDIDVVKLASTVNNGILENLIKTTNKKLALINPTIEEIKKKKKLYHILPYTGVWTSLIAGYLVYLQTNSLQMDILSILDNSQLLVNQFEGFINLELPIEEDIIKLKEYGFLDRDVTVKSSSELKNSLFSSQLIRFGISLSNFCKLELEKSGIIITNINNEVDISLDDNYTNAINNRLLNFTQEKNHTSKISYSQFITIPNEAIERGSSLDSKQRQSLLDNSILGDSEIEREFLEFVNCKEEENSYCNKGIIKLVVDNRELTHQGIPCRQFENLLNILEDKSKVSQLSLGDFIWIYLDNKTNKEYVLDYIIERKTLDDLAASILDGRYREQKQRLKKSNITNIYYLIEGVKFESKHMNISQKALETAILNTITIHDINIIKTDNIKESANIIIEMDKNIREITKNLNIDQLIPFEDFQKNNQKTKNQTVRNIFIRQLSCFESCGLKTLEMIGLWFGSPKDLRLFLLSIENPEQRNGVFNAMSIISSYPENKNKDFLGSTENLNKVLSIIVSSEKSISKMKKEVGSKYLNKTLVDNLIDFYTK